MAFLLPKPHNIKKFYKFTKSDKNANIHYKSLLSEKVIIPPKSLL